MFRLANPLKRTPLIRLNSTTSVSAFTQIEGRWSKLPEAEQGAVADRLYELQRGDWKKMTLEEKRAGKSC